MKEQIRKQYQQQRRTLTAEQRCTDSMAAIAHLLRSPLWQQSRTIMAYLSLPQELSLDNLYRQGWLEQKTMLIPISQPADLSLALSCLENFDDLAPGAYGIRELPANRFQPIPAAQIDLCLVPGIAFDHHGNRMGFGAGYYDRFLPLLRPDAIKIGTAFSLQLSASVLPIDQYDVPMDYLLTESGLLKIAQDTLIAR